MSCELAISNVIVGDRHRKQFGDIAELAKSIADIELMHPIVVTQDWHLIAGQRRLMVYQHLGLETIPATVINLEKLVLGEYAEARQSYATTRSATQVRRSSYPQIGKG